jgi:hypothetical protein
LRRALLASLAVALAPALARADRCSELATPASFDAASAMRAVFCEYDAGRRATLLPPRLTPGWNEKKAQGRAFPLFAGTFEAGGVKRGVLVVGRRQLHGDEPVMTQREWLGLSFYLFREQAGRFVYERGLRDWIPGWRGAEPRIELAKLGPDRFVLWFHHEWMAQGNTGQALSLWSLADPGAPQLLFLQTQENNEGNCTQEDGDGLPPCWTYDSDVELLPGADGWGLVRVTRSGTEPGDDGKVVPAREVACYARTGERYEAVPAERCGSAGRPAQPDGAAARTKSG